MGVWSATAANMLEMVGIGPFLTIPLILSAMGGPQAMVGWLLGAVIALCDGLVWAELGAAMPGSGGPYQYLKEGYNPARLGRLMSFLFLWGTMVSAPLSIASGAVGFAQYARYLAPGLGPWEAKGVAVSVVVLATALLYRDITAIGKLSVALWAVMLLTIGGIIAAGVGHFDWQLATSFPPNAWQLSPAFFTGLGAATLVAMYDYGGYFNVCLFGGEVRNPGRTIPRSILTAILTVAALYLTMNTLIIGVVPWQEAVRSSALVSDFIARLYGPAMAQGMTVLVLVITFASVFAVMLGYSRVPYAAAVEGRFFRPFARLHPTRHFPSFAVLSLGGASMLACLLTLDALIKGLMIFQILSQFLAQIIAVTLIRRHRPDIVRPFRMWLYPLPSLVAFSGWTFIVVSNGWPYFLAGLGLVLLGVLCYLWQAKQRAEWPFAGRP